MSRALPDNPISDRATDWWKGREVGAMWSLYILLPLQAIHRHSRVFALFLAESIVFPPSGACKDFEPVGWWWYYRISGTVPEVAIFYMFTGYLVIHSADVRIRFHDVFNLLAYVLSCHALIIISAINLSEKITKLPVPIKKSPCVGFEIMAQAEKVRTLFRNPCDCWSWPFLCGAASQSSYTIQPVRCHSWWNYSFRAHFTECTVLEWPLHMQISPGLGTTWQCRHWLSTFLISQNKPISKFIFLYIWKVPRACLDCKISQGPAMMSTSTAGRTDETIFKVVCPATIEERNWHGPRASQPHYWDHHF